MDFRDKMLAHQELRKASILSSFEGEFEGFQKGRKSLPIGTIHDGYKKISDGVWKKVSEHNMTHAEHNDKSVTSGRQSIKYASHSKMKEKKLADSNFHREQADKIDDKDYSENHVLTEKKKKIDFIDKHKEHVPNYLADEMEGNKTQFKEHLSKKTHTEINKIHEETKNNKQESVDTDNRRRAEYEAKNK